MFNNHHGVAPSGGPSDDNKASNSNLASQSYYMYSSSSSKNSPKYPSLPPLSSTAAAAASGPLAHHHHHNHHHHHHPPPPPPGPYYQSSTDAYRQLPAILNSESLYQGPNQHQPQQQPISGRYNSMNDSIRAPLPPPPVSFQAPQIAPAAAYRRSPRPAAASNYSSAEIYHRYPSSDSSDHHHHHYQQQHQQHLAPPYSPNQRNYYSSNASKPSYSPLPSYENTKMYQIPPIGPGVYASHDAQDNNNHYPLYNSNIINSNANISRYPTPINNNSNSNSNSNNNSNQRVSYSTVDSDNNAYSRSSSSFQNPIIKPEYNQPSPQTRFVPLKQPYNFGYSDNLVPLPLPPPSQAPQAPPVLQQQQHQQRFPLPSLSHQYEQSAEYSLPPGPTGSPPYPRYPYEQPQLLSHKQPELSTQQQQQQQQQPLPPLPPQQQQPPPQSLPFKEKLDSQDTIPTASSPSLLKRPILPGISQFSSFNPSSSAITTSTTTNNPYKPYPSAIETKIPEKPKKAPKLTKLSSLLTAEPNEPRHDRTSFSSTSSSAAFKQESGENDVLPAKLPSIINNSPERVSSYDPRQSLDQQNYRDTGRSGSFQEEAQERRYSGAVATIPSSQPVSVTTHAAPFGSPGSIVRPPLPSYQYLPPISNPQGHVKSESSYSQTIPPLPAASRAFQQHSAYFERQYYEGISEADYVTASTFIRDSSAKYEAKMEELKRQEEKKKAMPPKEIVTLNRLFEASKQIPDAEFEDRDMAHELYLLRGKKYFEGFYMDKLPNELALSYRNLAKNSIYPIERQEKHLAAISNGMLASSVGKGGESASNDAADASLQERKRDDTASSLVSFSHNDTNNASVTAPNGTGFNKRIQKLQRHYDEIEEYVDANKSKLYETKIKYLKEKLAMLNDNSNVELSIFNVEQMPKSKKRRATEGSDSQRIDADSYASNASDADPDINTPVAKRLKLAQCDPIDSLHEKFINFAELRDYELQRLKHWTLYLKNRSLKLFAKNLQTAYTQMNNVILSKLDNLESFFILQKQILEHHKISANDNQYRIDGGLFDIGSFKSNKLLIGLGFNSNNNIDMASANGHSDSTRISSTADIDKKLQDLSSVEFSDGDQVSMSNNTSTAGLSAASGAAKASRASSRVKKRLKNELDITIKDAKLDDKRAIEFELDNKELLTSIFEGYSSLTTEEEFIIITENNFKHYYNSLSRSLSNGGSIDGGSYSHGGSSRRGQHHYHYGSGNGNGNLTNNDHNQPYELDFRKIFMNANHSMSRYARILQHGATGGTSTNDSGSEARGGSSENESTGASTSTTATASATNSGGKTALGRKRNTNSSSSTGTGVTSGAGSGGNATGVGSGNNRSKKAPGLKGLNNDELEHDLALLGRNKGW